MRLPNWIGDIVMATPLLRALRAHWPDAQITVAGPAHAAAVLAGLTSFDATLELPQRSLIGVLSAARLLARERFDLAVLMTNSFSSALVTRLAGIPRRVGYAGGGRGPLLSNRLVHPAAPGRHRLPTPMVDYYLALADAVGAPRAGHRTELATSPDDERRADAWLARQGLEDERRLIGIHPGSSFGPSKLWYPERFAAVADRLLERHGGAALVFCGPTEHGLARAIAGAASGRVVAAADDPLGLGTVKALVRRLALLISTDTGPRHFGPAFDVPTVVLMGATDPRFTNTNLHSSIVVRAGVDCSPCQLKVCPIDHRCMRRLGPEHVLAACRQLLGGA